MSRRAVVAAVTSALALLLGGCTVTGARDTSAPASPSTRADRQDGGSPRSPSSPGTTHKPPVPPAPKQPACYRLKFAQLPRSSNGSRPVRCRTRHDAVTYFVGTLGTLAGRPAAVDSKAVQEEMARRCPRRLRAFIGGGPVRRHLSRFGVVWFSPTPEQADRGADWFRCDLIAFAGPDRMFRLPRPNRLRGVLDAPNALDTYGLCGTAAPGAAGFERVICARRHSWRAISTISLSGGASYPGPRVVRRAGDSRCKARVKATLGFTLQFSYGWEWPTRQQWRGGQHYGYCWAPD